MNVLLFVCNLLLLAYPADLPTHSEWVIKTDNLSNVYVYNKREIKKYSSKGKLLFNFSDNSLGDISMCDTSDPFNILLYYSDFRHIIILDNRLNKKPGLIYLDEFMDDTIDFVSRASNGDLFFYLSSLSQVLKYSAQMELLDESFLLSHYLKDDKVEYMSLHNKVLYIIYDKNIIVRFDENMQFISKLYLAKAEKIFLDGEQIYFLSSKKLYSYRMKDAYEQELVLDDTLNLNEITISNGSIIIYNNEVLRMEKLK